MSDDDIIFALKRYSNDLKDRLVEEFRNSLPQIELVLSALSGRNRMITREQIEEILTQELDIYATPQHLKNSIKILYQAGVLGVVEVDQIGLKIDSVSECYYYDDPDLEPLHAKRYCIHRGFVHSMNLEE